MMKTFTPFFFLFFFFSVSLSAQTTYTSNGGDWFTAATWTPNGVPGVADTAIINTGTTTISDNVTVGSLYMSAGTISGDSNLSVTDSLSWTGGTISFSSASSELKAKFTIASSAKANVNGFCYINRCLVNEGEFHWVSGFLAFSNNYKACFLNYGTIFDESNENASISGKFGDWFINYGKYSKSGTGINNLSGIRQFVNSGEVKVDAGKLILPAGYSEETGSYMVGTQAYLDIAGPRILSGPVRCEGMLESSGQYVISVNDTFDIKGEFIYNANGLMYFNSGSTPLLDSCMISVGGNFVFRTGKKVIIDSLRTIYASGGVATNDSLVVRKYADFTAGTIDGGTGVVIFDEDAEVNVSLAKYTTSNNFQGQIDNYGTFHWKEGTLNLQYKTNVGAAVFNNYGLFIDEVTDSYNINGNYQKPSFNNYGIYQKKSAFPSGFSFVNFVNKERGVITGEGSIAFSDPMENMGAVSPGDSVGVLKLTGEYLPDSVSSVNIDIGGNMADTQYDRLEIEGDASLKGTLNISLLTDYIPDEGEIFEIMKFTSRTDTFDVVNGTEISNCRYFAVQYSDTSVRLEVYGIEPPQAVQDTISFRQDLPVEINVLANDTNPDGDTLLLLSVGNPAHGTAVVSGDSTITYTPETGFVGLDTMVYVIQKRSGCIDSSMAIVDVLSTVGIEELPFDASNTFHIEQNYPNPFDVSTTFKFSIPEEAYVELRIFSIHGRLMKILVSKKLPVGSYNYEWEAPGLVEGIYIYQFSTGKFIQTGKMFKMK